MIDHTKKFIFVRVPKTASSALHHILWSSSAEQKQNIIDLQGNVNDHPNIRDIENYFNLKKLKLESYFKFCIVRNPYDRLVSNYFYSEYVLECWDKYKSTPYGVERIKEFGTRRIHELRSRRNIKVNCFLKSEPSYVTYCKHLLNGLDNFKDYVLRINEEEFANYRLSPQIIFTHHGGNYDVPRLDFIGRYENLQDDFDYVCEKLDIKKQKLKKNNESSHEKFENYYDEETKDIVERLYNMDIETFGYEFGE